MPDPFNMYVVFLLALILGFQICIAMTISNIERRFKNKDDQDSEE